MVEHHEICEMNAKRMMSTESICAKKLNENKFDRRYILVLAREREANKFLLLLQYAI